MVSFHGYADRFIFEFLGHLTTQLQLSLAQSNKKQTKNRFQRGFGRELQQHTPNWNKMINLLFLLEQVSPAVCTRVDSVRVLLW